MLKRALVLMKSILAAKNQRIVSLDSLSVWFAMLTLCLGAVMQANSITDLPGWPKSTGTGVSSSPALGDLDGDSYLDVVVGSDDGKVYAWDRKGNPLPGWPKSTGGSINSSPALGDLDKDGYLDVVVGSLDKNVYAWDRKGNPLPGWPESTEAPVSSSPALGDLDKDGYLDVVVGSWNSNVYAWDRKGSLLPGWSIATGGPIYSSPALGDLDGDGVLDVVVGSWDKKVYAWDRKGSPLPGWPRTTEGRVSSSPALGDLDGNGYPDVVVGSQDNKVYAWDNKGNPLPGWPKSTGSIVNSSPALGDLDADGYMDLVVGSSDNNVYVWDRKGSLLPGWPKSTGDQIWSSPALGDIDGDGYADVVVGSFDKKVYAWDRKGNLLGGWPASNKDGVYSSPALGDLDADGYLDVVVGCWDNNVYAWNTGSKYVPMNIHWRMFRYDPLHSGMQKDDDLTGPSFANFSPSVSMAGVSFYISCEITDRSGVYDDDTGSEGQGVYLVWDADGDVAGGQVVKMSRVSGGLFRTDREISSQPKGANFVYQVTAYDNDFDMNNPTDRAMRKSEIQRINISSAPAISCTTHPNQNSWYNLANAQFSWIHATAFIYYILLDEKSDTIPTASTGKRVFERNATYQNLEDGTWYFHVISEIRPGQLDTETSHYQINIDTKPPQVSSTTHSDQTKWYQSKKPELSWTTLHPSSTARFYYIIDQKPDTVPTTISGTKTTAAGLTLSELKEGAWYFHIVWEDTAGNVGTKATHFRLNIDNSAPKVMGMSPKDAAVYKQGDRGPTSIDIAFDEAGSGFDKAGSVFAVTRSDAEVKSQVVNGTLNTDTAGHLVYTPTGGFTDGVYETSFQLKDKAGNAGEPQKLIFTIDQTPPAIVGLDDVSPKHGDNIPAANLDVKIRVKEQIKIETGNLKLVYEAYTNTPRGSATGTFDMVKSGDKSPYECSATLPLAGVSEGSKVDYWITGTDSVGNQLTSTLNPSLLAGGKATITIAKAILQAAFEGNVSSGGKAVPNATIQVMEGNKVVKEAKTDADGKYKLMANSGTPYNLRGYARGYYPQNQTAKIAPASGVDFQLRPVPEVKISSLACDFWSQKTSFEDTPVMAGDIIAVIDPDGIVAGVATVEQSGKYLLHVYGDDITTPEIDEGAKDGDRLIFVLNNSYRHTSGQALWQVRNSIQYDINFKVNPLREEIPLSQGWNLISFKTQLTDPNLDSVLKSIKGNYTHVIGYLTPEGAKSWEVSRPAFLNDLKEMDAYHGYWIKMTKPATLVLEGAQVAVDTPIQLSSGWNLVSYLPELPDSIPHALASIEGLYTYLIGFHNQEGIKSWDKLRPASLNDLRVLVPNNGYWLKVTQNTTLKYPKSGYSPLGAPRKLQAIKTPAIAPSPISADLWGVDTDLSVGDVITVTDTDNVMCGSAMVDQAGAYLIHVYGDILSTPIDEGAMEGETVNFFINGQRVTAEESKVPFIPSSSWRIALSSRFPEIRQIVPDMPALFQNFPNPFNPETWIPYQLIEKAIVTITIYDSTGKKVQTLELGEKPAGAYADKTQAGYWDGKNQVGELAASGVYFYHIKAGKFEAQRKMIIIR